MNVRSILFGTLLLLLSLSTTFLRADDWPWLGRDKTRNPVSTEKNPPLWWRINITDGPQPQSSKNIKWQAPTGGYSKGDPVVANGLVWVGSRERGDKIRKPASVLSCYREKDGMLIYQFRTPHLMNALEAGDAGHTSSPLIEGDRIWFTTPNCETVCLDIAPLRHGDGQPKVRWKVDMAKTLGVVPSMAPMGYGKTCSIAASYKDRIHVCTGNAGALLLDEVPNPDAPSLVCFDKNTGKIIWTDKSPGKNILDAQWSSPLVMEIAGRGQVIAPQGDGWLRSFDAITGELIWKFDTNPWGVTNPHKKAQLLATPVFHAGLIYIGNGHGPVSSNLRPESAFFCIDPTKQGDISPEVDAGQGKAKPNPNSGVVWKHGGVRDKRRIFQGTTSSAAISDGLVISAEANGYVNCLDAKTGKPYWRYDIRSTTDVAPLIVDGKVFIGNADGDIHIISLAKELVVQRIIDMESAIYAAPVFANGVLYVAARDKLYAIAGKERSEDVGHWPQWRGPERTNVAKDTGLLKSWPKEGPPLLWKAQGLGSGVPSVSIADGRIFTLGVHHDQEHLVALDEASGKLLWKTPLAPAAKGFGIMQWLSQRTPTVDGDRVYGFTVGGVLVCCEVATGKERWRKDYAKDFLGKRGPWGFCDFPLVDGDNLICTPGGDTASIVALDKFTGAVRWQCPIPGETSTYGALISADIKGTNMYIHQLGKGAVGISPGGKLLWRYDKFGEGRGNVHTALVRDDQVFASSGWGVKSRLLKLVPQRGEWNVDVFYVTGPTVDPWLGSSVLADDQVHTSCGKCIDWKTGEVIETLKFNRSTMTCAEGRLYHRSGANVVTLHEMTPKGYVKKGEVKPERSDKAGNNPTWTFPIIAGGRLYLRDQDLLLCYDLRAQKEHREPDAIFVPTPQDIVEKMLTLAGVKKTDVVYDLGCGDGRIVVAAAKKFGCKALGVDLDPECVKMARAMVEKNKVGDLVSIEQKDLFTLDLSKADVVALYLLPKLNVKLLPQLAKLKPGARIVSHAFSIEEYQPDQIVRHVSAEDGVEHTLYLWTMPLKKVKK